MCVYTPGDSGVLSHLHVLIPISAEKYTSGSESWEMSFRPGEQSLVELRPPTAGRSRLAAPWPTRGRSAQPGATRGCLSMGCPAISGVGSGTLP